MLLEGFQPGKSQGEGRFAEPPAVGRLGEIQVPTLVLIGDLDMPGILEIAGLLEKGISGAKKAVIPGTAHMVNMERPAEFNRIVLDFLMAVGK
jgi:pimeloyl-ACP methyl ester carboxylesterase